MESFETITINYINYIKYWEDLDVTIQNIEDEQYICTCLLEFDVFPNNPEIISNIIDNAKNYYKFKYNKYYENYSNVFAYRVEFKENTFIMKIMGFHR